MIPERMGVSRKEKWSEDWGLDNLTLSDQWEEEEPQKMLKEAASEERGVKRVRCPGSQIRKMSQGQVKGQLWERLPSGQTRPTMRTEHWN